MRFQKLTLHHFRNIGFASLEFTGNRQFLVGANGQGKTNLLEAAGFISALRSFRTPDHRELIAHTQRHAAIACELAHERQGETRLMIKLHRERKELWADQAPVQRLADHLGKFPTVVFSSQDLLLVRGAPAGRRRWLDLTLAAMDASYLRSLQAYARALAARNSLLKRGNPSPAELTAFEEQLAPAGAAIVAARADGIAALAGVLATRYAALTGGEEPGNLAYAPNLEDASADAFRARLESGRSRDLQFRSTLAGPHRDDLNFRVGATAAESFASEGQQRSLVLALRLAQADWFRERSGVRPVLLADDVLGELDPERRRRFWASLDPNTQLLATGTSPPDAALGEWQLFRVEAGKFDILER